MNGEQGEQIEEQCSNSNYVSSRYFNANKLGKGMNTCLLLTSYGLNSWQNGIFGRGFQQG